MITKFKHFNESINYEDEKLVRIMAWLSMFYVYQEKGLSEKSWFNDGRMGIKLSEAIPYLKDNNLIEFINNSWVITKKGESELFSFFNVPKNREEFLDYNSVPLFKYNVNDYFSGYKISSIPKELYMYFRRKNKEEIKYNLQNEEYQKIVNWLDKYQRGQIEWNNRFNKYCGLKGDLIQNVDKMILYRGINLRPHSLIKTENGFIYPNERKIKVGDRIFCDKSSWTISLKVARSFASGKEGLDDNRKMVEDEIGIVLKYEFNYYDLFIDTDWVDNNHDFFIDEVLYSTEYEVIVKPKNRLHEVIEIFNKDNLPELIKK